MPKRAHRPGASHSAHATFRVAVGYPRRGRRDATAWVDAGVFLSLGVDADLPERFLQHYGTTRLRTSRTVAAEISNRFTRASTTPGDPVAKAAGAVLSRLFMPTPRIRFGDRAQIDKTTRDDVVKRLKGLSSDPKAGHGGEADLIALAHARIAAGDDQQVLLSNDAGAATVAAAYDIPTRHSGDMLAEMACADQSQKPDDLYALFGAMEKVSRVAQNARPRSADYMRCGRSGGHCPECDRA